MSDYTKPRIIRILDDIADDLADFEEYFNQHPDIDLTDEEERAADDIKKLDLLIDWLDSMGNVVDLGKVEVNDENVRRFSKKVK